MPTVAVHAPKTPVTTGSGATATATLPNVCKMPPPLPQPNIGMSILAPLGFSTTVLIERCPVAILGASFRSIGDLQSLPFGGGIISQNAGGPTRFVVPGAPDVLVEGRPVHLLGDPTLNNNGPAGVPPNAATLPGVLQAPCPVP